VRELLDQAVFCLDCTAPDWQDGLRGLLDLPREELRRRWEAKTSARRVAAERAIMGPGGSAGLRAAQFLVRTLKGGIPGRTGQGQAAPLRPQPRSASEEGL
jgi:hypothetical protein